MSPVRIALQRPQNPMRQWLKKRECEKDELEEDPDSQTVSSDTCHSHCIEGFWVSSHSVSIQAVAQ